MAMMPLRALLYIAAAFLTLYGCVPHTSAPLVRERLPVSQGTPTVWNFDNPQNPFDASIGTAVLQYRDPANTGWGPNLTRFAKASEMGLPLIDGQDTYVMEFPAADKNQGYTVTHNSLPNGVFAWDGFVSNYTIILDVLWPREGSAVPKALYQTDAKNADNAEMYAAPDTGGISIGGNYMYHGLLVSGRWHRVAIAVQCALGEGGTGQIHKFIDGQFVGGEYTPGTGSRCRWALEPAFHLFTDNNGKTGKGYVSNIMYIDRFMSMDEIKALGGPNAQGANIAGKPVQSVKPRLAKRRIEIIAHRANSGHSPENTLAGIKDAFNKGADHIEVDVRMSSDGELVLMHDETVNRTTNGTGPVYEMSLSMLKKLDAGLWLDSRFAGERVPTLKEALIAAKGRGRLLLDVKNVDIGADIKQALAEAGAASDAVWLSQNLNTEDFKKHLPDAGILWMDIPNPLTKGSFDKLKEKGVVGFDINHAMVTKKFIDVAHSNGMFVFVYTVMDPDTMLRMINIGVDGMETDFPSVLDSLMPTR